MLHGGVVTHQARGFDLGELELMAQYGADQMLRAFAHRDVHHSGRDFGQIDVSQAQIECGFEIAHGVNHGAV